MKTKNSNNKYPKAIGIDLGTTHSCVGVWQNDRIQIIANDQGNRTTPSYVTFTEIERLIGESAKNQVAKNPYNSVFDAKRLIGKKFTDPVIQMMQKDMANWPFKVEAGIDNKPVIVVKFKGEVKKFYPEEISSMILTRMKQTAEAYLGETVKDAIIAVPAYFNENQRQATKDAGSLAGLNVMRLMNESAAAALAYGFEKQYQSPTNVLIFNLGGGNFDVSLILMDDGVFQVKSTAGNTHLGGEDFDNLLVDYCAAEFYKKHQIDIKSNARAMRRLRTQCEKAKRLLSSSKQTSIEVDSLAQSQNFSLTLTRIKFQQLCLPLLLETIPLVEKVLKDSKILKNQVQEVVLVGGSTRIPKVTQLLKEFFNGKQPSKTINPDEAVAYGAALQAGILSRCSSPFTDKYLVVDAISHSFSMEIDEVTTVLIPRNTPIPTKKSHIFTTNSDNETQMNFQLFEDDMNSTKDNNILYQINLKIQPAARGVPQIQIAFQIDQSGNMTVTAIDKASYKILKSQKIKKKIFSKQQMKIMIDRAQKFKRQDRQLNNKAEARYTLEKYCQNMKQKLNEALSKVTQMYKWLYSNENSRSEQFEIKQKSLDNIINSLIYKK